MPDYLSCGSCPVDFELTDITSYIEHKKQRCTDNMNSSSNTNNSDLLECSTCTRKFKTPWPLLVHTQKDHNIIIMKNFDQFRSQSIDKSYDRLFSDKINSQDDYEQIIDNVENDEAKENNHKDVFTQTGHPKTVSDSTCCSTLLPSCCQKIEPQVCEAPCECATPAIICTSNSCLTDSSNPSDNIKIDNKENSAILKCCECPDSVKKESREVQTDDSITKNNSSNLTYLSELNNTAVSDNSPKFPPVTSESSYKSNDINITTLNNNTDSNLNWNFYSSIPTNLSFNNHFLPTPAESVGSPYPFNISPFNPNTYYGNSDNNTNTPVSRSALDMLSRTNNYIHQHQPQQTINSDLYMNQNVLFNRNLYEPPHKVSRPSSNTDRNSSNGGDLLDTTDLDKVSSTGCADLYKEELMKQPSPEFKFTCQHCSKTFRQKVHLRKHIMSQHAQEKPHKCGQCSYTTVEKSHLTVHIRTHTGERPFTCRICSYSSAQNCTLKSHYLRRHPGDKIQCKNCLVDFITEQERNNHMRSCRLINGNNNQQSSQSLSQSNNPPRNSAHSPVYNPPPSYRDTVKPISNGMLSSNSNNHILSRLMTETTAQTNTNSISQASPSLKTPILCDKYSQHDNCDLECIVVNLH